MRLRDDCFPTTIRLLQMAQQVENLQEIGQCDETAAALVVLAEQVAELVKTLKGDQEHED